MEAPETRKDKVEFRVAHYFVLQEIIHQDCYGRRKKCRFLMYRRTSEGRIGSAERERIDLNVRIPPSSPLSQIYESLF